MIEILNHVGDLVFGHLWITMSVVTATLIAWGVVASGLSNRAHRRELEARRKGEDDARNRDA